MNMTPASTPDSELRADHVKRFPIEKTLTPVASPSKYPQDLAMPFVRSRRSSSSNTAFFGSAQPQGESIHFDMGDPTLDSSVIRPRGKWNTTSIWTTASPVEPVAETRQYRSISIAIGMGEFTSLDTPFTRNGNVEGDQEENRRTRSKSYSSVVEQQPWQPAGTYYENPPLETYQWVNETESRPQVEYPVHSRQYSVGPPQRFRSSPSLAPLRTAELPPPLYYDYSRHAAPASEYEHVTEAMMGLKVDPQAQVYHPLPPMPTNISWPLYVVEFKAGRYNFFYPADRSLSIKHGDLVIVDADRGKDLGLIIESEIYSMADLQSYQEKHVNPVADQNATNEFHPKRICRLAHAQDIVMVKTKVQDEAAAVGVCQAKLRQKKLLMEIVDAEYQWDRRKLTYYYIADRRVDFRELVRDLFRLYKTRIWM